MPKGAKKRARLKQQLLQQQGHPDDAGDTNASNGNCDGRDDNNDALSGRDGDHHLRIQPKVSRVDANEDSMKCSEEMVTPRAVAAEVPAEHAMKADVAGSEVMVDAFLLETTGPEREVKVDEAEVEVYSMVAQGPQVKGVLVAEESVVQAVEASDLKEVAKLHPALESYLKVDEVVVVEEAPVAPEVQEPDVKGAGATVVLNEPETSSGNVVVKDSDEMSRSQEAVDVHSTEVTASTAAQEEAVSKLKQEVGKPLHKQDKGKEGASQSVEKEVVESDDMEEDDDKDEEAMALWRNFSLGATLGNHGLILALVKTNTGFAIFMYNGANLFRKDALQNIWVDFANHAVAKKTVHKLEFRVFEHGAEAIQPNGVSDELATMIRKHIEPGQKLAVENKDYQKAIENDMKISCLSDDNVDELMWGLKVHMPYLVPEEKSLLKEEDRFSMSKGMKQLLESHGFILEANMMVTREIIDLVGRLHKCVRCVNKHDSFLRRAAEHLKRISHIDTREWDLMKLAAALKMICFPEQRIAAAPSLFPKRVLLKLKKDAPKYEGKILKEYIWSIYKEMYSARRARSSVLGKLSLLLQQRLKAEELIAELTGCVERQNPPSPVTADVIGKYTCIYSPQLHSTNQPGILSVHFHPSKDVVATGGIDTNAVLFDLSSSRILCMLTGHSKKITTLNFVNGDELFITGSADATVRIWNWSEYGDHSCKHIFKDHTAEVAAVTVQVSEKCFVSASKDYSWRLYDISTADCLSKFEASEPGGYTSASFHPRGLLLGTGTTTAFVELWDVKAKSQVAYLEGHTGPVRAISFSENGYHLATAALDGVRLWDVRKLTNLSIISPGMPTNAVEFDSSGSYLGIGGSDARVYQSGEWNIIKTLPDLSETGEVTSLKFGADAKYIAVGSMDRLRIFGSTQQMDV